MRPLGALLRALAWRRLREEPFRLTLTVVGVALGVAVYLAIQLANDAALRAFRGSLDAVSGRTQLQITGGDAGVPEDLYLLAQSFPGVAHAAPVVQQTAWIRAKAAGRARWARGTATQGRAVLVLGTDLLQDRQVRTYRFEKALPLGVLLERLADPRAIFLSRTLAGELGVGVGDAVEMDAGRRLSLRVRGILKESGLGRAMEGRLALMDIGAAQEAFGRVGKLDRIDLVLRDPGAVERVKAALQKRLPPGVVVERPLRRGEDVDRMLASFRLNLTALSVIALLVGCFLVFNAMSASVVRRRGEIAALRSLGMTSRRVAALFAAESGAIGLAGSALGVGLGVLLARGALGAVARTIDNLYAFLRVTEVRPDPRVLLAALAVGTLVSVLSGLGPALAAARVSPAQGVRRDAGGGDYVPRAPVLSLGLALGAAGAAWALSLLPPWGGRPVFGYLAAGAVVAAIAFASGGAVWLGAAAARRTLAGRTLGWLAAHGLGRHPGRNAVTVASLATAMAMMVSLVMMIASFRETVMVWTGQTLQADLYVSPAARFVKGSSVGFPEAVRERVAGLKGVAAVDGFRTLRVPWHGRWINVAGGDFAVQAAHGGLLFRKGRSADILRRARERGEVIVTEPFALAFGVKEGDVIRLPAPGGEAALRVAGVYYDYTTDGGRVVMDRALFRRLWRDDQLSSMAIYLRPGADRKEAVRRIERLLDPSLVLISNARLRRRVLEVFDQTFAITYALEAIAVLVAVLGVATGLSSNVLERRREIGTLRSLGLTRGQIARVVMGEAGLLGALSALLGALAGWGLAAILIFVINKQSFGWTIRFHYPLAQVGACLGLAVAAAAVAGWAPARAAARTEIVQAVREE